jgi:hypothetical protein
MNDSELPKYVVGKEKWHMRMMPPASIGNLVNDDQLFER